MTAGASGAIRALLIDDEEPARLRLRSMLDEMGGVEVVGEARDGHEALSRVETDRPDVVFLDIQMPGMSGLEVAASLAPPRPRVIFCTAFDQYAIDAFEHHATDYLLKPVNKKRLARSIDRVRVALADDRSRTRDADDVHAASRAQERLLPRSLPPMRRLDYAGACRAARGVGGDYYDFLPLPGGRLGLAVSDVSGKGLFAGLLVAGLQARIQGIAPRFGDDVAGVVTEVNRTLHDSTDSNRYATLFYGSFDDETRRLRYVNAGHNAPFLLRRANAGIVVERLEATGTVVGLLPDAVHRCAELELREGDLLAIFSDGLTEARNAAGMEFGEERLAAILRDGLGLDLDAASLRDAVLADVARFVGNEGGNEGENDAGDERGAPGGTTGRTDRAMTGGPAEAHDDVTLVVARVR